jgi:nucleoside phosphorylase/prenyltransferase beta subunit
MPKKKNTGVGSIDVAIITTLVEEFNSVRELLNNCRRDLGRPDAPNLFSWELGNIPCVNNKVSYSVVLAQAGRPGTLSGFQATYKTIQRWKPEYVFFVGIAGGLKPKELSLGDIVISDVLWGYEYGKIENQFTPRNDLTFRSDVSLLTGVKAFKLRLNQVKRFESQRPNGRRGVKPSIVVGPIASGDKVVDNPTQEFFASVMKAWPKLLAVEMEGVGAAQAISLSQSEGLTPRFIMIRGVSDIPQTEKRKSKILLAKERDRWKQYASNIAAVFTVRYIQNGLPTPPKDSDFPKSLPFEHKQGMLLKTTRAKKSLKRDLSDSNRNSQESKRNLLRSSVVKALEAITRYQNDDGGIPAARPGQTSGAWTTGSCLESLLLCRFTPVEKYHNCRKMIEYLLNSQLEDGGWPLIASNVSCTMSTGHVLSALILCKKLCEDNKRLRARVLKSIESGLNWLEKKRNSDGGWCVEPSGKSDATETRIAATYYALRPYWMLGSSFKNLKIIQDAVHLIVPLQRDDGGWPYISGNSIDNTSNVSNTARAILIILRSGYLTPDANTIRRAVSYIKRQRLQKSSWELNVEGFFAQDSHGQNVYHNNGPCDALEALLYARESGNDVKESIEWLIRTQKEDGIWELCSANPKDTSYYRAWTWSTTEFIYVLNLALETLFN